MIGLQSVIRGSLWLYVGGLLSSFLGYIYWYIASIFISPSVVGSAAAITSFGSLLITIFSLGLPMGLQRFVGLSKGKNDYKQLSTYFFTSLYFALSISVSLALIVFITSLTEFRIFNLSSFELFFVGILILLTFWQPIFVSLFNSILRTEVAAFASVVSSVLRVIIGVSLLYLGLEFVGVMLGLVVSSVTMDIVLLFYGIRLFKGFKVKASFQFSHLSDLLKAGSASWVSSILTVLGQSLAVLSIYGFVGGTETGLYYIAFAIASIIYTFSGSVLNLIFPVLSGMEDGRKRIASRAIKLSLAVSVPLALGLALYPSIPLSLLGPKYVLASNTLRILVLGALLSPIVLGYTSYIYATGRYLHVALIGLMADGSKLLLYVLLIPRFGEMGVATAYTLGFVISLVGISFSASKTGYRINWVEVFKIIIVPTPLAMVLFFLNLHWLISIPILFSLSPIAYTRLGIVTKNDLVEISRAFLSERSISKIYLYAKPIVKLMYRE